MEQIGTAEQADAMGGQGRGVVGETKYCIRCGYSLLGLPLVGGCPECNTSVELSLREPTLATASREYLQSIGLGLSLVLNGILLMIVAFVGAMFLGVLGGPVTGMQLGLTFVMLGLSGMIMFGYWKYTEPDPGQVMLEATNSARTVVRLAVALQAGLALVNVLIELVNTFNSSQNVADLLGLLALGMSVVGLILWVVQFYGVLRYTRWLATRVPDQRVISRTKTYQWLLPVIYVVGAVALFLGPLIALVLYWNLLDRMRKHVKSVIATGAPADLPGRAMPAA